MARRGRLTGTGTAWNGLDWGTRQFWRTVGRRIDPYGVDDWLYAPHNRPGTVGDAWLDALDTAGRVLPPSQDDGLLPDMAVLDGPEFRAADLHPAVREFYQYTARYRMDVWSQWTALFAPGGELVARFFGRRVKQLALPVQPLAVSRGMTNTVRRVDDPLTGHHGTAWLRTLLSDGSSVYSGFYRLGRVPNDPQPCVGVSFPLEEGSVQVLLRPRADRDGSLWLESRSRRYGEDGAYVVVRSGGHWYAAMPPLRERFHVFVDEAGVLRTDHSLALAGMPALRLHYRLDRISGSGGPGPVGS